MYSHIMVSPDLFLSLFIYVFIYLFVYESRASVTWSSVVVLVVSLGSSSSS